jgi:3-deoxy-D-manno-octulosonic-acid transferase
MVAEAHATLRARLPNLLTIVVPRHPQRGGEVAECAAAVGLRSAQRSLGGRPHGGVDLYVADTLGELGLFYRLAPLVFLGGSMTRRGGQNPIEPTRLDAAILHGPNVQNFAQVYRALDEAGGARMVADAGELATALADLLLDAPRSRAMAAAGNAALRPFEGAVERTLAILDPFIAQMKLTAMAGS